MSRWWRAEDTSIDHPKLLKLSDAMFRAWYTLNCVASANDGVLPPADDIAVRLRMKPAKVAEWITKLVTAGLYDNDGGVFRPHNWNKRQYKTDVTDPTAAKRAKDYRDRKRDGRDASRSVTRDATVRDERPEAEAKTETEAEHSRADVRALDEMGLKQEGLLKAAFTAECAGRPKAPDMSIIGVWLLDGISVGTISSTVPAILRRKRDMATLAYCDAAVREAHAKAAPSLQVVSSKVWVDEGTQEWASHQAVSFEKNRRGTPVTDQKDADGRATGRRGWYFETLWAEGFNDFGERIAPSEQESAA